MKYAWIENDTIRDISHGDPATLYHPDIATLYDTQVPDNAANGDGWVNGELVKPVTPDPVEPEPQPTVYAKVSPVEFTLLFAPTERIAIRTARATDPAIDDFMDIIEDPRLTVVDLGLGSTQAGLGYLESIGILTSERKEEIIQGILQ